MERGFCRWRVHPPDYSWHTWPPRIADSMKTCWYATSEIARCTPSKSEVVQRNSTRSREGTDGSTGFWDRMLAILADLALTERAQHRTLTSRPVTSLRPVLPLPPPFPVLLVTSASARVRPAADCWVFGS
jgi:hypothetical protein